MDKYEVIRNKTNFICDMDGVIYHGNKLIPHVKEFIAWLENNGKNYCTIIPKIHTISN